MNTDGYVVQNPTVAKRQLLLGQVVRESILDTGRTFTDTATEWGLHRTTLNRMMRTGDVGARIIRIAEINLGFPPGALTLLLEGRTDAIAQLADLDPVVRARMLNGLAQIGPGGVDEGPLPHQRPARPFLPETDESGSH